MKEEHTDLVVVAYFGYRPETVRDLLMDDGIRIRHAHDLASLQKEMDRQVPDAVLVDRWLPGDEAPGCVALARDQFKVPALLMVAEGEFAEGGLDFPQDVDGVLEKPLRGDSLLDLVGRVRREEKILPQAAKGQDDGNRIPEAGGSPEHVEASGKLPGGSPGRVGSQAPEARRLLDDVRETLRRLGEVIKIDSLSGLMYRDFFLERSIREAKRASRYGQPLSALMIDVDDFKSINDRHGHETGNRVLALLGEVISGTIRTDLDVASRLHGDEFALVLPATSAEGARCLARRIQDRIRSREGPISFTLSIGVHCLEGEELTEGVQGLLEGADRALLQAKHGGKNRITLHGERGENQDGLSSGGSGDSMNPGDPENPEDIYGIEDPPSSTSPEPGPGLYGEAPYPGRPVETDAPAKPDETASPGHPLPLEPPEALDAGRDERVELDESDEAASNRETRPEEDPLSAALIDAVASLAGKEDFKKAGDFRGKALLVSEEKEVADILVKFLGSRGISVETAGDFPSALTMLDSLEFFLVLASGQANSPEIRAFGESIQRIDEEIFLFVFVEKGEPSPGDAPSGRVRTIPKPFLLSELYLLASRAREDYHLRRMKDDARPDREDEFIPE